MKKSPRRRTLLGALLALACVVAVAGVVSVAWAAIGGGGVVKTCFSQAKATWRPIDNSASCKSGEMSLSFYSKSGADAAFLDQTEADGLYLGKSAQAADSDKLDGLDSTEFMSRQLYGAGGEGDVTLSADETLSEDKYYDDLTLDDGVVLNSGGYRVFVRGTLTMGDGSRISRNGNNAQSFLVGGAGLAAGTLGGSGAGGSFPDCTPDNVDNGVGGHGGLLTFGGGAVNPPPEEAGGAEVFQSVLSALSGRALDGSVVNGGSGGGTGTQCQAAGGSGGGVVVVAAHSIVVNGSAAITATGGNGQFNGSNGAGGGGGGVVAVMANTPQPAGLTLSAAGGSNSPACCAAAAAGRTYYFGP